MARELIEIDEAQRLVLASTRPLAGEPVELQAALGRVLAVDVKAVDAVPAFDSSAMDGFAVRASDIQSAAGDSPTTLRIVDESRAGHPASRGLGDGEAIAISTGAMLPAGADAVIRVEQTRRAGERVEILAAAEPGCDVRYAGQDISAGALALAAGTTLGPAELGVLASVGCVSPLCARRPRVAILTTGDELVEPGRPLRPGSVHNSNAHTIRALARCAGAEVVAAATVPDTEQATTDAIAAAIASADVVVVCGGVSVGEHDHVRDSLATLGAEQRFYGIALKPGKPTWFGTIGETLVFALPGNPVSAMVTFILLARPALYALSSSAPHSLRTTATLSCDYRQLPGRAHAVRCGLKLHGSGWSAEPTGEQGSHILTSMVGADALAIVPAGEGLINAGEQVEVVMIRDGLVAA